MHKCLNCCITKTVRLSRCSLNWFTPKLEKAAYSNNAYENGTGCGHAQNQVIRESNGVFRISEEDGFGEDYQMQMTRNSNWSDLNWTLTDVTEGETIYWTTTASDGRIWYHKGQVETTSNVNRS